MTLSDIILELESLKEKAEYLSRTIIENGRITPEVERVKAAAYAEAYSFCIFRLKEMNREQAKAIITQTLAEALDPKKRQPCDLP